MKKITLLLFVTFCFTLNAQVLTEGFEGGIPVTWTQTQIDGTTDWIADVDNQNGSVVPRTGTQMAYFYVGNYVNKTSLETPVLDLTTLTTPVLTFYYTNATWGGDTEELRIFYKNSAAGTWTQLAEFTDPAEAWTEVNIVLPNPTNDYYIAFEAKANWGRGATLDDILVDELSGCLPVGSLTTIPTSTTDSDLNWVASGSEGNWTYEYGLAGYTQGTGQIGGAAVTAETASISGLTSGTDYDFYVQANCGGGDGDSTYAGPFTWTQPDTGQACGTAIAATVDPDCTTPLSLDFSTGVTGGASCDTFNNTLLWVKTTTPAGGGIEISMSEAGDAAIFDACNGTEVACGPMPLAIDGLAGNTEYYIAVWKDAAGSTAVNDLCIVSYTAPLAPDCSEAPSFPADDATGISGFGTITLSWTAPSGGETPTAYNIYSGIATGALTLLATVDAPDTIYDTTVGAYSTEIFWSVVPVNGGIEAAGPCLEWSFTTEDAPPPPSNNDCGSAIALTASVAFDTNPLTAQTNSSATDSGELPLPGCAQYDPADASGFGGDVWYSVVVPGDGNITLETAADPTGNGGDSGAAAYSGTCGSLVLIECDDDDGDDGAYSKVEVSDPALAGQTIYFRVWEYDGDGVINFQVAAYNATLSTTDFERKNAFTYFPNPVNNELTLKAQNNIQNVSVLNMLGQEVLRTSPNALESKLDMNALSQGSYFVQVTINNVTEIVRIIKD